MTDLASGGAKVAKEMVQELQQAMVEAEKLAKENQVGGAEQFQNVMQNQQVQGIQPTNEIAGVQSTTDIIRAAAQAQPRAVPVPAVGQSLNTPAVLNSGLQRFMGEVVGGQEKLQKLMELAMSGRNFNSNELIALQAGVYRFTQELELTSKVIEKGTSAIKQTLNTQV